MQQDVLRLDVAVDHTLPVGVVQRVGLAGIEEWQDVRMAQCRRRRDLDDEALDTVLAAFALAGQSPSVPPG